MPKKAHAQTSCERLCSARQLAMQHALRGPVLLVTSHSEFIIRSGHSNSIHDDGVAVNTFWSLREVTSCRKSESALRSGQCICWLSKKGRISSLGPWYTSLPAMNKRGLHIHTSFIAVMFSSLYQLLQFDVFFARLMVAFATKQGDRLRGNAVAVCTSKSVTSKVDCQQEQHSHKGRCFTRAEQCIRGHATA